MSLRDKIFGEPPDDFPIILVPLLIALCPFLWIFESREEMDD